MMDTKDLVLKSKQGDKDAFSQLYLLYKDSLYRYAYYRIGNVEDAMDAVSDTVLSAYQQIQNIKNPSAFSTYIFTIHRSTCARYLKALVKNKQNEELGEDLEQVNSDSDFLSIELKQALMQIGDDEREIVLLSISGFNSKEIAKITGYTAGSVRSKLSRALAKMRAYLE